MGQDGFGTLSARIMQRGSERVRVVLDEKTPERNTIPEGMTIEAGAGPHTDRAYDVPPATRTSAFAKVPPLPGKKAVAESKDKHNGGSAKVLSPDAFARVPVAANGTGKADTADKADKADKDAAGAGRGSNPVGALQRTLEERRGGSGANLTIKQPQTGDMSQVTVTMSGVQVDHETPQQGGQAPTSITYERRTLHDLAREAKDLAKGKEAEPVWIETPSYSGPDRRTEDVSPEVERRRTVPPRIKVGVRLEQERYLRLKLAVNKTGRTQQDMITSALDTYLDKLGHDRFVRIAMGFGVESDGSKLDDTGT